jgi:hypothetical protein
MSQGLYTRAMLGSLLLVFSLNRCWFEPLKGGGEVLPIVSILSHQTCFTETPVTELEYREIDWMLRKCSQVKRKAEYCRVLDRICHVTVMPICVRVEFLRYFVGYSALCAEITKDNRWDLIVTCM